MADVRNVLMTTPTHGSGHHDNDVNRHDRSSPSSSSPSSSPNASSKSGRSSGGSEGANRIRRLGTRLLVVVPFRGGPRQQQDDDVHPRPGHGGQAGPTRGRRRPRLLTEETWWVMHNPAPHTSDDNNRNQIPIDPNHHSTHPSGDIAAHRKNPFSIPSHPSRGARLLGRMRIQSVDRGAGTLKHLHDVPLEFSSEDDDLDEDDDLNDKGVRDAATPTDPEAEDQGSIAASKLSTLSNVSERRIAWHHDPPSAPPPTATLPLPADLLETTHRQPHHHDNAEGGRFQFSSVPLEIFVPTAAIDASSNVPEWLRITPSRPQDRISDDEGLDDSDGDHDAAFDLPQGDDDAEIPPPPPHSPRSVASPPPRQLLMPRLAPLVTTEPSPSIPRPTLGKHSQSAPAADLYYYGPRRPFPPATPASSGHLLPRPQSLHQISTPTRRPQSVATGARDGYYRSTSTAGGGARGSSFRTAHQGSSCMMSAAGASHVSQLSDADQKLLGARERYPKNGGSGRFPSGSSVLTLSVGSLVGQSSWVTAPGMTVATSSGSFEPNSRGSPRSRRSVLAEEVGPLKYGIQKADGIDCGSVTSRSRLSLLRVGRGDVVSRWMDRGVAWMSATTTRYRRSQQAASPLVRIVKKGPDVAPVNPPELQRSSGCLT